MHKTIHEPAREIPVVAEADVVVCGGGPGGVPAAIAAARHGAKVVLIERYGFMGGLATAGLVSPILAHKAHAADFAIVEGILREITERMHALGGAPTWEETLKVWGINFDAECLKIVLDEMCQEAGVELLLHSYIADVATQDGQDRGRAGGEQVGPAGGGRQGVHRRHRGRRCGVSRRRADDARPRLGWPAGVDGVVHPPGRLRLSRRGEAQGDHGPGPG